MSDSTRSGHVGHERAARSPELVVEPDAGRQGQDAGADARPESFRCAGAVALEAQDVLEGLKDRLDAPADAAQVGPAAGRLVRARRAHHAAAEVGHGGLEVAPDMALVADD